MLICARCGGAIVADLDYADGACLACGRPHRPTPQPSPSEQRRINTNLKAERFMASNMKRRKFECPPDLG